MPREAGETGTDAGVDASIDDRMGFEYRIRHQPKDRPAWEEFLRILPNPRSADDWPAFTAEVTDSGLYFCDHGRSEAASAAFRRIIDKALSEGGAVTIEED